MLTCRGCKKMAEERMSNGTPRCSEYSPIPGTPPDDEEPVVIKEEKPVKAPKAVRESVHTEPTEDPDTSINLEGDDEFFQ